jgi:glutathionylspermidine synthase
MEKKNITQLPDKVFGELGWDYFVSDEASEYLTTELVVISEKEQEAYYHAGNQLYERFVSAGEHVLQNNLLDQLGIPKNLHEVIRLSWEDDRHLHLFGRFDFAGGLDGLPIKLIEFNADTPTSLPETGIIQWAQLKANDIDETKQFNFVYEALTDNFKRLRDLNPDREPAILFTTMRDAPEDDNNVSMLTAAAKDAGFETSFSYIDEVVFSEVNGIFGKGADGQPLNFPFWFKLVPWEFIALEEPELCKILTKIVQRDQAIILNPAYTMIFQSKGILKYLWDLFPNDPLLLEASFQEPIGRTAYPFVQKVFFGREGSNVTVYDSIGLPLEVSGGEYEKQRTVFQAYADLARDQVGQYYQAGVFFAYEACGLGFRRSTKRIIDDGAQFVGHTVGR